MEEEYPIDFRLRENAKDIFQRRAFEFESDVHNKDIVNFIIWLKREYNIYLAPFGNNFNILWETIVNNESVLEFVLKGSMEWQLRCFDDPKDIESINNKLSQIIGIGIDGSKDAIFSRLPSKDDIKTTIKRYPFFLFLIYLEQMDLDTNALILHNND